MNTNDKKSKTFGNRNLSQQTFSSAAKSKVTLTLTS